MGTFKKWSVSKRVFCPNKAARRARFRAFRCLRVTGNVFFAFPYGIETCLVLVCVAVAPFCRIKIWRDSATPQKRCGSSLQPSVSRALQFAQQRLELRGAGRLLCGYVSHGQHLGASVKGRGCGGGRVDGGPADRHCGEHRRGQKKPARGWLRKSRAWHRRGSDGYGSCDGRGGWRLGNRRRRDNRNRHLRSYVQHRHEVRRGGFHWHRGRGQAGLPEHGHDVGAVDGRSFCRCCRRRRAEAHHERRHGKIVRGW
mmetsp:Transcript_5146/g.17159  ORF Transcript_5146/g.17159 Transcript_5146/m.17159 type:complete len:255 (+) Transcript_5146:1729-2493(+)